MHPAPSMNFDLQTKVVETGFSTVVFLTMKCLRKLNLLNAVCLRKNTSNSNCRNEPFDQIPNTVLHITLHTQFVPIFGNNTYRYSNLYTSLRFNHHLCSGQSLNNAHYLWAKPSLIWCNVWSTVYSVLSECLWKNPLATRAGFEPMSSCLLVHTS